MENHRLHQFIFLIVVSELGVVDFVVERVRDRRNYRWKQLDKSLSPQEISRFCNNLRFDCNSRPNERVPEVKYLDAYDQYGKDFETILSKSFTEPFWLIDIPIWEREFYDRLSDDGKTLVDMDLILPLGFGEALSGGEREWEYRRIVKRMEFKGSDPKELSWYMEIAEDGNLVPTAGCGFGVERLTRYLCSLDHVAKTRLFPKVPGQSCI